MSVLSHSWRCLLVATALWAMLGAASAPAAAGDQPATTPPAAADRQKLEQRLQSIKQKVEQLEKDGKHDEAQRLKREAYEMMTKLRGGSTAPPSAVSGPEADKIRGQLKELSQKVEQLEKDGKHDEAERLRSAIRVLYGKIDPRAAANALPGGPEREQLYQQMRALHEKIAKAKQEGKQDEVQRLMQEAEALRAKLYAQAGYASTRSQPGGDRDARLQHLRAAAENLKAAGCEPEAQHVMQMIQRMQAEGNDASRPGGERTRTGQESRRGDEARGRRELAGESTRTGQESRRRDEARDRRELAGESTRSSQDGRQGSSRTTPPGASAPNAREYGNSPAVQELRGQVEQMRRELRELREQLNQAKGSQNR